MDSRHSAAMRRLNPANSAFAIWLLLLLFVVDQRYWSFRRICVVMRVYYISISISVSIVIGPRSSSGKNYRGIFGPFRFEFIRKVWKRQKVKQKMKDFVSEKGHSNELERKKNVCSPIFEMYYESGCLASLLVHSFARSLVSTRIHIGNQFL